MLDELEFCEIKEILERSVSSAGTVLINVVPENIIIKKNEHDGINKFLELDSIIFAKNDVEGEVYTVKLECYAGIIWVLTLESSDSYLIYKDVSM